MVFGVELGGSMIEMRCLRMVGGGKRWELEFVGWCEICGIGTSGVWMRWIWIGWFLVKVVVESVDLFYCACV